MKKIVLFLAAATLTLGASAQMLGKNMSQAHQEFRKAHQMRMPKLKEGMKTTTPTKMTAANSTASSLPVDRWFPGEWEEVQAITVTWPYWSVPANWEELGSQLGYYSATASFSGYGTIYKYVGNSWREEGYGPIDQLPYCVNYTIEATDSENMDFIGVFAYLIDAIRIGGAEPWVRVTHLSDSVYIQQPGIVAGIAVFRLRNHFTLYKILVIV